MNWRSWKSVLAFQVCTHWNLVLLFMKFPYRNRKLYIPNSYVLQPRRSLLQVYHGKKLFSRKFSTLPYVIKSSGRISNFRLKWLSLPQCSSLLVSHIALMLAQELSWGKSVHKNSAGVLIKSPFSRPCRSWSGVSFRRVLAHLLPSFRCLMPLEPAASEAAVATTA